MQIIRYMISDYMSLKTSMMQRSFVEGKRMAKGTTRSVDYPLMQQEHVKGAEEL